MSRYIHRNTLEIKGASKDALDKHLWSSYLAYINKTTAPNWLTREQTYKTLGRANKCGEYQTFVLSGNDARTEEFYGGDSLTGIFGDESFRQSVYEDQESFEEVEGLSKLINERREMDTIVAVVAKAFAVDPKYIVTRQAGRRERNIPRRVVMYCSQRPGDYSQKDIANYFSLHHPGSVSSAIQSIANELEAGELTGLFGRIKRDLNIV